MKSLLKKAILKTIELIESYEYRKLSLDQNNTDKKIINSKVISESVNSDSGFVDAIAIHKTQPYTVYNVVLENGYNIKCADNHILFKSTLAEVFTKDLCVGDNIFTDIGPSKVISVEVFNHSVSMFDMTINTEDHRYYTNGILSHNTVIAGIFLVWYMLFHYDKNIMLAGNKGVTAKEILDKAKMVIQNLPFFLKPAMVVWNQFSISSDANSRILATTTTDKAAIGFTIHLLFLDEFAHVRENIQRSFYDNIYPVISAGKNTKIIITSTPNGYDLFQQIFDLSMKGKNDYKSMEIPWWKVPGRGDEWAKTQVANMGEEAFNEQFNCSFLRNDTLLLSGEQLRIVDNSKKKFHYQEIPLLSDYMLDHDGMVWSEDFDLDMIQNNSAYFFLSIDLAEGVGRDYTVMQIFQIVAKDAEGIKQLSNERFELYKFFQFKQVGMFRRNDLPIDEFCKICYLMFYSGKFFNIDRTKAMLEWNTYGSFYIEKIKNLFGGEDYDESIFIRSLHRKGARARKLGIRQDKESKPRNCVELKSRIAKKDIIISEEWTAKELGFFSRNKRGSYEAVTGHDDTVMACVNLMECYRGIEYADTIAEAFDRLPQETQTLILETMGRDTASDESTDFLADANGFSSLNNNNNSDPLGFM